MTGKNQELVDHFFAAYMKRDFDGIREVMSDSVTWYFLGRHPYAGVKNGINEVVAFFDTMGGIMSRSRPTMEKLITAENESNVIECSHIKTNLKTGLNIDHHVCVLWTIEERKIITGRHFFADPESVDAYFTTIAAG